MPPAYFQMNLNGEVFFQQIDERNMSKMVSVPILVQTLALLFRENKQLPENYKTTYDELVLYLRKKCEDNKGLTDNEIKEAMNEINQLAFRGLTRDDRQLVFSRDEIKNENIMEIRIVSCRKIRYWIQTNHCVVFSAHNSTRILWS